MSKQLTKTAPVTIMSSHGSFTITVTGDVISNDCGGEYPDIVKFDVSEWEKTYKRQVDSVNCIDILDIGTWHRDGRYSAPEAEFRAEAGK